MDVGDRCLIHVATDLSVTLDPNLIVERVDGGLRLTAPWLPPDASMTVGPDSRVVTHDGRESPNLYDAVMEAYPDV